MSSHCETSYFPKHFYTKQAATEWQYITERSLHDSSGSPINPALASCERYDDSRRCPTGPCGARTGWNFIPGQIAQWKWSTDYNTSDPAGPVATGGAPFFQAEHPMNYCGNHLSWDRLLFK